MTASPADIDWARQAWATGRPLSFIASVLEMPERKARAAICGKVIAAPDAPAIETETPEEPVRTRHRLFQAAGEELPPSRRKTVLRRQFARHWDMIWHLRRHGMSGRSLRNIYGADALIWSVGGGIDTEIL